MKRSKLLSYIRNRWLGSDIAPKPSTLIHGPDSTTPSYYRSAHEMPLAKFIICICDENMSGMIISGSHELSVLQENWLNIYIEFIELTEDADVQQVIRLTRERYILLNKKQKVHEMVKFMAFQWDEDIVRDLRRMNYKYKFDPLNKVAYSRDLNLILTRAERFQVEADVIDLEIKAINDKNEGSKIDRKYFTARLTTLTRWMRDYVDPAIITVAIYAEYLKQYNEYCNQVNAKQDARNR